MMSSRKRRKIEEEAPSPSTTAMSAFALRQKLRLRGQGLNSPQQEMPPDEVQSETLAEDIRDVPSPVKVSRKTALAKSGAVLPEKEGLSRGATPSLVSAPISSCSRSPEPSQPVEATSPWKIVQLSSPRLNKKNFRRQAGRVPLLQLHEGERLVLLGSYGIQVRSGEVIIAGATLRQSEDIRWIHAPHCHALPVIRCSDEVTIALHAHPASAGLRDLGTLAPTIFGRLWNEGMEGQVDGNSKTSNRDSFSVLYTTEDGPKSSQILDMVSPPEWNKKLAAITAAARQPGQHQTILVCGPKSSGKSTFSRLLSNRLVTDEGDKRGSKSQTGVAILDIDPGQPEFGPPGVISLVHMTAPNLEPPFCHPYIHAQASRRILRSHAIAAVSPATNDEHYLECVLDLYSACSRTLRGKKCPLVVNTPGWVQGTGLAILSRLISRIRPTVVVYMSLDGPEETVEGLREACGEDVPFTTLPSQPSRLAARTPAELRTMQMMSYFHLDLTSPARPSDGPLRWNPSPLTAATPWVVRYSGSNPGISGIICYDYEPRPELLADLINGMILAVVEVEDAAAAFRDMANLSISGAQGGTDDDMMDVDDGSDAIGQGQSRDPSETVPITRTPEGLPMITNQRGLTLDPRLSRLVGLCLVRGIDAKRKELLLLTPIPSEEIVGKRLVLVWGQFDKAPTWSYAEELNIQRVGASRTKQESVGEDEGDSDGMSDDIIGTAAARPGIPYVEILQENQRRVAGSKVLRVRRDLGRNTAI